MEIHQKTHDAIVLSAAKEVLDQAEMHVQRWKKAREIRGRTEPETGLARASGFGPDLLADISAMVDAGWRIAETWWINNSGNVEAGFLVEAIIVGLNTLRRAAGGSPPPSAAHTEDERETNAVITIIANEIAVRFEQPRR